MRKVPPTLVAATVVLSFAGMVFAVDATSVPAAK